MATFRASQATDMRAELGRGIPIAVGGFEIVIADATHTTTFEGRFFFSGTSFGNVATVSFGSGFDVVVPLTRGIEGTLLGYEQDRRGVTQFVVEDVDVDAFQAFFALFRLRDTQLFQSLVFAGNDVLLGSRAGDVLIGYAGDDQLWGFNGNDRLSGRSGTDSLYGLRGADALSGGSGRDWLWGGDGDDRLSGGIGRDYLRGEDGRDVLAGGRNADRLWGGADADTFRFASIADSGRGSSRRDQIRDFRDGDLIDLRTIDADATARGNQPFAFIGAAAFTDDPGQLRFDRGSRLVQGDTDGNGKADFEIRLSGSFVPGADEFML